MTVSTQGSSFRGGRPPKAHLKITASTTTIAMLTPQAPGSCPPARATVAVASAVAKAVSPTSSVNWLVSSANWWSISRTSSSWITSIEADHAGGELLAEGRGAIGGKRSSVAMPITTVRTTNTTNPTISGNHTACWRPVQSSADRDVPASRPRSLTPPNRSVGRGCIVAEPVRTRAAPGRPVLADGAPRVVIGGRTPTRWRRTPQQHRPCVPKALSDNVVAGSSLAETRAQVQGSGAGQLHMQCRCGRWGRCGWAGPRRESGSQRMKRRHRHGQLDCDPYECSRGMRRRIGIARHSRPQAQP